jgi:hypothetical protein
MSTQTWICLARGQNKVGIYDNIIACLKALLITKSPRRWLDKKPGAQTMTASRFRFTNGQAWERP